MSESERTPSWVERRWAEWLQARIEESGKSARKISIEAGMDGSYVYTLIKNQQVPRRANVPALAAALGVRKSVCYIAAGYIPSGKVQRALLGEGGES